jgi:hypothetical protein
MTASGRTVRGLVVGVAFAAATAGLAACGSTAKTHPAAPSTTQPAPASTTKPAPAQTSAPASKATTKAPSGGGAAF